MEQQTIKSNKRIYGLNKIAYVGYRTNLVPLLLLDEDGRTFYAVFPECNGVSWALQEFKQHKVKVELHKFLEQFRLLKYEIAYLKSRG